MCVTNEETEKLEVNIFFCTHFTEHYNQDDIVETLEPPRILRKTLADRTLQSLLWVIPMCCDAFKTYSGHPKHGVGSEPHTLRPPHVAHSCLQLPPILSSPLDLSFVSERMHNLRKQELGFAVLPTLSVRVQVGANTL